MFAFLFPLHFSTSRHIFPARILLFTVNALSTCIYKHFIFHVAFAVFFFFFRFRLDFFLHGMFGIFHKCVIFAIFLRVSIILNGFSFKQSVKNNGSILFFFFRLFQYVRPKHSCAPSKNVNF